MSLPPAYTTRFISVSVSFGGASGYTVPDGYRAVVTDISGFIRGSIGIDSRASAELNNLVVLQVFCAGEARSFHWRGRQVLYAGESIQVSGGGIGGGFVDFAVTGFLFVEP